MSYSSKPWTKHYDPGVPVTLQPYPEQTIYQILRDTARRTPDAPAALMSAHVPLAGRLKRVITYAELDAASDTLAAALIDMGVKKGDRVALVMPNCTQF